MPTMKEVAALAGVSVGTVSNVLAGLATVTPEMRERVESAVKELRYQPNQVARSLKTRQTRSLGVVVSDISNPFFADVICGAEDAATRFGYTLSIVNTGDNVDQETRAVQTLCSRRADGLLVVPALTRNDHRHLYACQEEGVPLVCLDRVPEGIDTDTVSIDNAASAREAVEHLLSLGHRRIAYLGGRREMYTAGYRQQGYLDAMSAAGLPVLVREGGFNRQDGLQAIMDLMSPDSNRPTAALCGNIQVALGAMQGLKDLHLEIPRDLALATFDHLEWLDVFHPQLTAIVQPAYRIGFEAADLLIRRLSGALNDPAPQHLVLPTRLRVAESTLGHRA